MRRDKCGRLGFVNIDAPGFTVPPRRPTHGRLIQRLHAQTAAGQILVGMDAERASYRATGAGWLLAPTAWPGLRPVFDALYAGIARVRYPLGTGVLWVAKRLGRTGSV